MKSRVRIAAGLATGLATLLGAAVIVSAQAAPQQLIVDSPVLKTDQAMPKDYTPDGKNVSPPLTWSNAPAATRQFAVILEDPDAGNPPPYVHWVIYNIPATAKGLPENVPIDPAAVMPTEIAGAVQGMNGFRRAIYRGPAPPPGNPHHYHFIVYALDQALNLAPGLTRPQLLDAMKGHIVGQGEIVPTYQRAGTAGPAGAAPGDPAGRGRGRGRGL